MSFIVADLINFHRFDSKDKKGLIKKKIGLGFVLTFKYDFWSSNKNFKATQSNSQLMCLAKFQMLTFNFKWTNIACCRKQ